LALLAFGVKSTKYAALFYWAWAVKNVMLGPLKKDAGVVSFLVLLMADLLLSKKMPAAPIIVCIGISAQALYVLVSAEFNVFKKPADQLAAAVKKSVLWAKIFKPYLVATAAYWIAAAFLYWKAMA